MKNIIKLITGLLFATLFFAGCDTGNDSVADSTPSEKVLVGIQITKKPKVEYFINEPLTLEGIEVMALYSNNTSEKVRIGVSNVSGFDSSTPGQLTLTVTYKDKITTFDVTVDNVTLSKIEIINEPTKTEYWMYEELILDGLEVIATLSNGNTETIEIDELETSGFNSSATGIQNVTINIKNNRNKTASFTVTITPKTFTIAFDKNGGDTEANPNTKTVVQPAPGVDSLPTPPTKAGYNFTGWNTRADGNGINFTAGNLVTSSFTVYAQWFKPTVTFNSNGGSAVESQNVNYGITATKPADPVKNAYDSKFEGWYTDNTTFNIPWNFTNTVTENIALYAKWQHYELGDTGRGGGKIFYRDQAGFNMKGIGTCYYLEAAPIDLDSVPWGGNGDNFGTTGTAIGDGKQNTQIVVTKLNSDGETNRAVHLCVSYNNNGLNDWFLPSKSELYQLFLNRNSAGITLQTSSSSYYWSSSEGNSTQQAWAYISNSSGTTITDSSRNRTNSAIVCPIRAF